LIDLKHIWQGW